MEKDWLTNKEASQLAVLVFEAREEMRRTGEQDLLKVLYTLAVNAYRKGQPEGPILAADPLPAPGWIQVPASGNARTYGGGDTIHQTSAVNVELDENGKVVSVWFRCLGLPFTQRVVDADRAESMRRMSEDVNNRVALIGVSYQDKESS